MPEAAARAKPYKYAHTHITHMLQSMHAQSEDSTFKRRANIAHQTHERTYKQTRAHAHARTHAHTHTHTCSNRLVFSGSKPAAIFLGLTVALMEGSLRAHEMKSMSFLRNFNLSVGIGRVE